MALSPSDAPVRPLAPIRVLAAGFVALLGVVAIGSTGAAFDGRTPAPWTAADTVTFTRDVAPILQASCQNCHPSTGPWRPTSSSSPW